MPFISALVERSWLGPATLLAAVMSASVIGTTLFAPEYSMTADGLMIVSVFLITTLLGSTVGYFAVPISPRATKITNFELRRGQLYILGYVSAVAGLLITLQTTGTSFVQLLSPSGLMSIAQQITQERYTAGLGLPMTYNVANSLLLTYAIVLGVTLGLGFKHAWWAYVPILIFWFGNIIITTRAPIIFSASIVAFAFIYGKAIVNNKFAPIKLWNARVLLTLILGGAGVLGLFYFVQTLRFGESGARDAAEVLQHLRKWPFGSLPSFSMWWEGWSGRVETPFGYYTFTGILDNLGIAERVKGGFDEYVALAAGERGNVYTIFRGLIMDFGFTGAGVFCFLLGALGGVAYKGMRRGRLMMFSLYTAIICFMLWSFVISFFSFTSHIACFVLGPLALKYFAKRHVSSQRVAPKLNVATI
ncbi:hypothetical protein ASE94_00125 [Devosia sp. Leaf64]|nr:hypothetical protein ASE94_00125 [Devosia sp. Leaf64]